MDRVAAAPSLRRLARVAALAAAVGLLLFPSSRAGASASLRGHPTAMVIDRDGNLWVAESGHHGVTEIAASTGRVIRSVTAPGYTFNDPVAIAAGRHRIWVLNGGVTYANGTCTGGRVVVIDARRGVVSMVVNLRPVGLRCSSGIATDGTHVWVSGADGGRLVELSAATGRVERTIFRSKDVGDNATNVVIAGGHLWYCYADSVVERWAGSGAWIRSVTPTAVTTTPGEPWTSIEYLNPDLVAVTPELVFAADEGGRVVRRGGSVTILDGDTTSTTRTSQPIGAGYEFARAITADSQHVWIANGLASVYGSAQGNSIDEFDAVTGRFVGSFYVQDGPYSDPWDVASDGVHLFVGDLGASNVLEYSEATGRLIRVIGPKAPRGPAPT